MKQKNTPLKETKNHSPFGLRKAILFVGIVSGLLSGYLLKNYALGLCVHLAVATLVDQLAHYVFHLKSSSFVDSKQLLLKEEITPEDLDRHYDAKRNIRLLSLVLASASQVVFLSPELFLTVFVTSTLVGRFYAWYQLDIVGPKVVHELTKEDHEQIQEWQKRDSDNITLGFSTGMGPYGHLKPDYYAS